MVTKLITRLALTVCLIAPATVFADATSSPGKASAYTSISGVAIPLGGSPNQATVQILKGKKKRVLEVDVTVILNTPLATNAIGITATVNGVAMEPGFQIEHVCSASYLGCTAQALYWIDLDTAEASNPGMFINVPLDVTASVVAGVVSSGQVSVRARLVKK